MKKIRKIRVVLFTVTATVSLGFAGYTYLSSCNNQKKIEGLEHLMMRNARGLCVHASSNPIGVIIQKSASEKEKKEILNAIQQINEISAGIEYKLVESKNLKIKNYLEIYTDYDITDQYKTLGKTHISYSEIDATIKYPIKIYIDDSIENVVNTKGESLFSLVLKHELMHTLGFRDVYDENLKNKTIMFHNIDNDTIVTDFTDFDIQNIQQIYGKSVEVEYPTENDIYFKHKDDEYDYQI